MLTLFLFCFLIWSVGFFCFWFFFQRIPSGQKLADLFADLKIHDNKEAHLKKLKAENADQDGLKEAEVNMNFNSEFTLLF